MKIEENVELRDLTTFRIGAKAKYFCKISKPEEVMEAVNFAKAHNLQIFVLGGGSNIIMGSDEISALVIKNEILGREIVEEDSDKVIISVGAGESWDEFVEFAVEKNFSGIEALSAIPGTVGGAPIQNIGAYGAEAADTIDAVEVFDIESMNFTTLTPSECEFSYRDSVFKRKFGKYVVLKVLFRLRKGAPIVTPDYPGVKEKLIERGIISPTLLEIRNIIKTIRANKLPDPKVISNVGSFFKNPIVIADEFEKIKEKFPDVKFFAAEGGVKIPAGWLIENAGFKGRDLGKIRIYENNALVLVNNGEATPLDVFEAEKTIKLAIKDRFGIELEREPVIVS